MTLAGVPTWLLERDRETAVLRLGGDWLARETGMRSQDELRRIEAASRAVGPVRLDTSRVGGWDSALVAFICALDAAIELDLSALPDPLDRLLSLARAGRASSKDGGPQPRRSVLWRVGTGVTALWVQLGTFAGLIGESLLSVPAAATGRLQARAVDVLELVKACGADALPIIAIVNGLVGAILGFVGAVQLQRFGAATYVIDLVGVAVVREMAPIMTAIVMAGRTGGAYAAQIATMQGNEEVDALQTLGISVDQFLVVPRIIAALTMTPLLYAYGCFMGLLGGLVVCIAVLHMSPVTFFVHLRPAIPWTEFAIGLTKSICFGTFVAFAGCRTGLAAGRSAFDVGRAATHAVVQGIIGIIALDAVFAACTNVMGL